MSSEIGFFPLITAPTAASPTNTDVPAAAQAIQQSSATRTSPPDVQSTFGPKNGPPRASMFISKLPPVFTFMGSIITGNADSTLVIDSRTLTPGGNIDVSGTMLSMAPDGMTVFVDKTSTQLLDPIYAAGTQTLSVGGPAVTISGIQVSIETGGESAVIGGSTTEDISALLGAPTSSVTGIGGAQGMNPSSIHGTGFKNVSRRIKCQGKIRWQVLLLVIIICNALQ